MFEKLGVRNNLRKLVKSNFSLYRIILICFFIYYEIKANSSAIPIDLETKFEIIIVNVLLLLILPLIVSKTILKISHLIDKARNRKMSEKYYRDILNGISCVELTFLDDNNVELKKDIVATLLELNLKKKIKFDNEKIIVVDNEPTNLTKHERYILNKLIELDDSLIINQNSFNIKIKYMLKKVFNIKNKKNYKDNAEYLDGTKHIGFKVKSIWKDDAFGAELLKDLKESKIVEEKATDIWEKIYKRIKLFLLMTVTIILIFGGSGDLNIGMHSIIIYSTLMSVLPFFDKEVYEYMNQNVWCMLAYIFIEMLIFSGEFTLVHYLSQPNYYDDTLMVLKYIFLGIILFVIFFDSIMILKSKRLLTKKGKDIKRKLCGLKMYLNDFSAMKSKDLNEIDLWDEYIIYSVVINENKKITRKVWKMFKNTIGNN